MCERAVDERAVDAVGFFVTLEVVAGEWTVWRQDDNGNSFQVAEFATVKEAESKLAALEGGAYPHRQTYWIAQARITDTASHESGTPSPPWTRDVPEDAEHLLAEALRTPIDFVEVRPADATFHDDVKALEDVAYVLNRVSDQERARLIALLGDHHSRMAGLVE